MTIFLLLSTPFLHTIEGQTATNLKKLGDDAYSNKDYYKALDYYERYEVIRPDDNTIWEQLALSYFHVNMLDKAVGKMSAIQEAQISTDDDFTYYLARIYHETNDWENAINTYKSYLKKVGKKGSFSTKAITGIKAAANAIKFKYNPNKAYVENLGENVNSIGDDFHPVLSPNYDDKLYFSSSRIDNKGGKRNEKGLLDPVNGTYKSDIFISIKENGLWNKAEPMENLINSGLDEVLYDFSLDGQIMYFYKGKNRDEGLIYADTFNYKFTPPLSRQPLTLPFNPIYKDKDIFIIDDDMFLFSAIHPLGYGGYDIYLCQRIDGEWSRIVNLGPQINTANNERAPFITPDISQLIFSSDRQESIGSYDFFISRWLQGKRKFSPPQNLGIPLNSVGNDLHFILSPDGTRAYFSSDRKDNSYGGEDIFTAFFKNPLFSKAIASEERKNDFAYSFREVYEEENTSPRQEDTRPSSDNETPVLSVSSLLYGNDDIVLNPRNIQTLNFLAEKMKSYPKSHLLVKVYDDYDGSKNLDLYFCAQRGKKVQEYLAKQGILSSRIQITAIGSEFPIAYPKSEKLSSEAVSYINKRIDLLLDNNGEDFIYEKELPTAPRGYTDKVFLNLQEKYHGLSYRIQVIAASQMYESTILTEYPYAMIDIKGDPNIMKYTIGLFNSYAEANNFRQEIIENGIRGAYIVPYIDGIRKTNYELEQLKKVYPDISNYLSLSKQ